MGGDSAFRRLLLDTVSTALSQPPSSSSLIELLRIATPDLLASSTDARQRKRAEEKVRNVSKREKLFRTLQLRIHPDKHDGDERATELFQEVTSFYERCVEEMHREDDEERRRRRSGGQSDATTRNNDGRDVSRQDEANANNGDEDDKADRSADVKSQFPQWYPWWYRVSPPPGSDPRRSTGTGTRGTSTHSDYENCDYDPERPHDNDYLRGRGGNNPRGRNPRNGRQPLSHQAMAALSTILFPPLGICALMHSLKVRKAWDDGRFGDARDHSDQAYNYAWYAILCFACIFLYLWLSDGDGDWDWDRMKHDWGGGP